jgi:hypothetical protein
MDLKCLHKEESARGSVLFDFVLDPIPDPNFIFKMILKDSYRAESSDELWIRAQEVPIFGCTYIHQLYCVAKIHIRIHHHVMMNV